MLDASTSMKGEPLAAAKEAAQAFLDVLRTLGQTSVSCRLPARPSVLSDFTTDREESASAIRSIDVAGETALYDGVVAAAAQFDPVAEGRRTVVLLSDGGDTISEAPIEDAIAALLATGVSFYAVELQSPENDGVGIARIAAATNGTVVPAEDPAALAEVFATIGTQISNQYRLSYTSESYENTEIVVSVAANGITVSSESAVRYPQAPATPITVPPGPDPVPADPATPDPAPAVDVMALRNGVVADLAWYQGNQALILGAVAVFLAIAGIVVFTSMASAAFRQLRRCFCDGRAHPGGEARRPQHVRGRRNVDCRALSQGRARARPQHPARSCRGGDAAGRVRGHGGRVCPRRRCGRDAVPWHRSGLRRRGHDVAVLQLASLGQGLEAEQEVRRAAAGCPSADVRKPARRVRFRAGDLDRRQRGCCTLRRRVPQGQDRDAAGQRRGQRVTRDGRARRQRGLQVDRRGHRDPPRGRR